MLVECLKRYKKINILFIKILRSDDICKIEDIQTRIGIKSIIIESNDQILTNTIVSDKIKIVDLMRTTIVRQIDMSLKEEEKCLSFKSLTDFLAWFPRSQGTMIPQ